MSAGNEERESSQTRELKTDPTEWLEHTNVEDEESLIQIFDSLNRLSEITQLWYQSRNVQHYDEKQSEVLALKFRVEQKRSQIEDEERGLDRILNQVQTAYDGLPPMLKAMTAQDKTGEDDFGHQADAQTELADTSPNAEKEWLSPGTDDWAW